MAVFEALADLTSSLLLKAEASRRNLLCRLGFVFFRFLLQLMDGHDWIYKFNDLLDWKIINNIFMLNPFPLLSLTFMVNALGLLVNGGYDKPP